MKISVFLYNPILRPGTSVRSFVFKLLDTIRRKEMQLSSGNIMYWLNPVLLAVIMAAIQFQMIQESFGERIHDHIGAIYWNLEGIPIFESYQSRVLGPYMIEGMHRVTGWDFETSYQVVHFLYLFTFYLVLYCVARSFFKSGIIPLAVVIGAGFICAFLMQGMWLYPWDLIHLIIFTVIIWMILTKKPLWCIALVVFIEIFNHHLRYILAGWLVLDAIVFLYVKDGILPRLRFRLLPHQLITGIILGILGYSISDYINDAMILSPELQQAVLERYLDIIEQHDTHVFVFGNIGSVLPDNLNMLKASFLFEDKIEFYEYWFEVNNPIIFNPLILGIPMVCLWAMFTRNSAMRKAGILFLLIWGALVGASPLYEVRIWLPFVPFLTLVIPTLYGFRFGRFDLRLPDDDEYT